MSGVVGWPYQSVGSGPQALSECREWWAGSSGVSRVVDWPSTSVERGRWPYRCVGSGRQAL